MFRRCELFAQEHKVSDPLERPRLVKRNREVTINEIPTGTGRTWNRAKLWSFWNA
jgi:hypothetical protein